MFDGIKSISFLRRIPGKFFVPGMLAVILLCACNPRPKLNLNLTTGSVVTTEDVYGTFFTYIPSSDTGLRVLVIVHGTPAKSDTAEFTARYYIENWVDFAEQNGFVLIVPAFNQEDFSSREGDHAMSGYRGLFGREIGADEWVLRLVKAHQAALDLPEDKFYLYGHSAGGQFTSRFLVMHPEWIEKALITAAATYPQPTTEIAWPYGMGELHAEIEWDAETSTRVDIVPELDTWLAATQIPLTILVGLNDTSEIPPYPGQKGSVRYEIGNNWVEDMAVLAQENGMESCFSLKIVPGKGHSMWGLIPYSQQTLLMEEEEVP